MSSDVIPNNVIPSEATQSVSRAALEISRFARNDKQKSK
jgi:hypothetical protein